MASNIPVPSKMTTEGDASENWKYFKEEWENYAIASGLNNKEPSVQVATLKCLLGRETMKILEDLKLDASKKSMVSEIVSELDAYFSPAVNIIHERYIFGSAVQGNLQSINQYVARLRRLVSTCSYGTLEAEMIRDRLVLGIRDEETRKQLICDAELTLDTAIAICRVNELSSALKMKSVQTTLVPEQGDKIKITTGGNARENREKTEKRLRQRKSKATAEAPISFDDQNHGQRPKFAELLKFMNRNDKKSWFFSSWWKYRDDVAKILQADSDKAMEDAHAYLAKIEGSVSQKAFIEIVTMAVIKASLKDGKLVVRQINKFDKLILKYVDNTEDLELICLFAIKNFVVKEAALELSVLTESFRHLYDDSIISVEAFKKWKDDTSIEPLESEGRLLATKTLEPFYVFLAEADDEEEES